MATIAFTEKILPFSQQSSFFVVGVRFNCVPVQTRLLLVVSVTVQYGTCKCAYCLPNEEISTLKKFWRSVCFSVYLIRHLLTVVPMQWKIR